MLIVITAIQFACLDAVIGTLTTAQLFVGILFDNLSLLVGMILFGLYTNLPDQAVQILGAMPFLFMIFFSTTFSPGSGVKGVKALRYLFSRFYLWCMLPEDLGMEGCPESNTLLYLILSSLFVPFMFVLCKTGMNFYRKSRKGKSKSSLKESMKTVVFAELQLELFGEKALENLKDIGSSMRFTEMKRIASQRSITQQKTEDTQDDDEKGFDNFVSYLSGGSDPETVAVSSSETSTSCENV